MSTEPDHLGRYELLARIGAGGMAEVWRARDPLLDRPVAIKLVGRGLQSDPQFSERFRREAQVIARLRHPHIVQAYDFGEDGGGHFIVMEFVEGCTLADRLAERRRAGGRLPVAEALTILGQAAEALDYAHAQGIVHRDVKPANILLRDGRSDEVVLADFGLALLLNRTSEATLGASFGTPEYIAPEQALRSSAAVPRSDVYSLGVVAYRLLTGALPFDAESPIDLALQHVSAPPRPLREHDPALPPAAEAAVLKALEKDPERRYASAAELVAALRAALAPPAEPAGEPGAPEPPTQALPDAPAMIWPDARREAGWLASEASPRAPAVRPATQRPAEPPAEGPAGDGAALAAQPVAAAGPRIPVVPLLGAAVLALCACLFFGGGLLSRLSGWNPFRAGAPPAASTLPATSPATAVIPPATAAPTVGALTPAQQLDALRASVTQAREQELVRGNVGKELAKKLEAAAEALAKGDSGRAREQLEDFLDLLDEEDERRLPAELRAAWQAGAEAILAQLP